MPKSRRRQHRALTARRPIRLCESATTVVDKVDIAEAGQVEAGTKPGRMLVQLIAAGWSLNNRYYSAAVLKQAATDRVFPAGTPNFADHMTSTEEAERPVGSVRDLASAQSTDAHWDEGRQALMAEVRLFAPWREAITDMAEYIGMSIRADGEAEYGEAEGRQGLIINRITAGKSVDYVTKPAAGGSIVAVLESVAAAKVAESIGLAEAPTNDTRDMLSDALNDAYSTDDVSVYVRDFDPDRNVVWFAQCGPDIDAELFQQAYTAETGAVTLTGKAIEVTARTVYEPAVEPPGEVEDDAPIVGGPATPAAPMAEATTTAPPKLPAHPGDTSTTAPGTPPDTNMEEMEGDMPNDPTVEAREATDTRVTEAETKLAEALAAKAASDAKLAKFQAVEAARPIVDKALAESALPGAARTKVANTVLAVVPMTEALVLDKNALTEALAAAVTTEAAYIASLNEADAALRESAGEGKVTGFGSGSFTAQVAESIDPAVKTALLESFKARGMSPEAAAMAAAGRP